MRNSKFVSDINNFLLAEIENKHILLNGYIIKTPASPLDTSPIDAIYTFISSDLNYSIKCIFPHTKIAHPLSSECAYEISIFKYSFDFLTIEKDKKNLQYNLVILLYDFTVNIQVGIRNDISALISLPGKFPININSVFSINEQSQSLFNKSLQNIMKEFSLLYGNNTFFAKDFINKKFDKDSSSVMNSLTLFDICKLVMQKKTPGILLISRLGVEFPINYLDECTNDPKQNVVWKNLIYITPTMKGKVEENVNHLPGKDIVFTPSLVSFKNFNGKNAFSSIINNNGGKHKIFKNLGDIDIIPQKVKDLISFYGNVNMNVGKSFVEKYKVYKKYVELINK